MSKTVEFDGKIYEIGKHYFFYDLVLEDGVVDTLTGTGTGTSSSCLDTGSSYYYYAATIEEAIENGWLDAGVIILAEQASNIGYALEVNGKAYEVGKHYWFYDCELKDGVVDTLTYAGTSGSYFVTSRSCHYHAITLEEAITSGLLDAGTITQTK